MIHQPLIYGTGLAGTVSDIDIETKELVSTKQKLSGIIAKHTGKAPEQVLKDTDRNYYMSAHEAKEYGLIDEVR